MSDDNVLNPSSLDGLDDSRRALLALLNGMRRTLYLYTPLVRADLYDDPEVLDVIRARVVDQPKLRLHLVLPPAKEWRSACPRLARLVERFTSALLLRTPIRGEVLQRPELHQAFAIADEQILLRFHDPRRLLGKYEPQPGERMKELLELFQTVWRYAESDLDLRRLGI